MEEMVNNADLFYGQYKGKRVLVTGHTGFKGSWLSLWLSYLGADVVGFSKYLPSDPCHFEAANLENRIDHCMGDVCDLSALEQVFNSFSPEIVFHLAAQPIVRESYQNPKITFDTNLGGTVNVLECLKQSDSVQAAVMITSDKCYENIGIDVGYKETDQLGGADPYSASKACAEIAISSYIRSFFLPDGKTKIAATRAGNVIGGGDWAADRIVPDCVRAWSQGEEPIIRNPDATRPWQHVLEPLSGYLWLACCLLNDVQGVNGQSFNFGPKTTVVQSVKQVTDIFLKYWGEGSWKHVPAQTQMKEAKLLRLSIEKASNILEWQPVLNFEETIELTAQWYKYYYDHSQNDLYDFGIEQIQDYAQKVRDAKSQESVSL